MSEQWGCALRFAPDAAEASDVLEARWVGTGQERSKILDGADVALLGLRANCGSSDLSIMPPQWLMLVGHGIRLSE